MKKFISITLLALMALALPVALVGCGKKESVETKLIGTWTQTKTVDYYPNGEIKERNIDEGTSITLLFNKDKTAKYIEVNEERTNESVSGSWEIGKNGSIMLTLKFYDEKEDYYYTEVWTLKFVGKELHRIETKENGIIKHEIFVKK